MRPVDPVACRASELRTGDIICGSGHSYRVRSVESLRHCAQCAPYVLVTYLPSHLPRCTYDPRPVRRVALSPDEIVPRIASALEL